MIFDASKLQWIREPADYSISAEKIEIVTEPNTDLWQRTYYHFRNDNAPVLQMTTEERFFSFVVKTEFESKHRFDQCGVVMYLDSENWLKASIEFENEEFQHLGSVVTNNGYSDWATTTIDASVKSIWYRFSRREDDYCVECSYDGENYSQMRVCHMWEGAGVIKFGIYACSPEDSSFKATFTDMDISEDNIVTITLTTDIYPEVTLGDYKGLKIEKAKAEVSDEQVQAELDRMAQNVASTETVERAAEMGDTAAKKEYAWDIIPDCWGRSLSGTYPSEAFYYFTAGYSAHPNYYLSERLDTQFEYCRSIQEGPYEELLEATYEAEKIFLEDMVLCPVVQDVSFILFADHLELPVKTYIPGFGWGAAYGDIVE